MGASRDMLRAATLGAQKRFASKLVKVGDLEIEVRQPSLRGRSEIMLAGNAQPGGKIDLAALAVEAAVHCSFVPGTDERLFDAADREALLALPAGAWIDEVTAAAMSLLNIDKADLEKNSDGTAADSSSLQ